MHSLTTHLQKKWGTGAAATLDLRLSPSHAALPADAQVLFFPTIPLSHCSPTSPVCHLSDPEHICHHIHSTNGPILCAIDWAEASKCLVLSRQVGHVFAAAHDDTPKQLIYNWRPDCTTDTQGKLLPALQQHSSATTPTVTHSSGQPPDLSPVTEGGQIAGSAVPHSLPSSAQAVAPSVTAAPSAITMPSAAELHLAERGNRDRKRAADAPLPEGPSKRPLSSTFSNSACGVDSSRSSAMSVSPAPFGPVTPPALTSQASQPAQLQQPPKELPAEAFTSCAVAILPIAPPLQGAAPPRLEPISAQKVSAPPESKGLAGSPGQNADSQGASRAEAQYETSFPQLFGHPDSPAHAPPIASEGQSPLICDQQGAHNKPGSIPDVGRGFGTLFGRGELSSLAADDSCNAFAAGGFNEEEDPSPSASSTASHRIPLTMRLNTSRLQLVVHIN